MYAANELRDGRRHVVRTYHAGDIIGLGELAVPSASADLVSAGDVRVCPFPKRALGRVFTEAPKLAALLLAMSARDQVILVDTLRAAARMNARDRVLFALLNWLHRLAVTNHSMRDTFTLRLNQSADRRHARADQRLGQQGDGRARERGGRSSVVVRK